MRSEYVFCDICGVSKPSVTQVIVHNTKVDICAGTDGCVEKTTVAALFQMLDRGRFAPPPVTSIPPAVSTAATPLPVPAPAPTAPLEPAGAPSEAATTITDTTALLATTPEAQPEGQGELFATGDEGDDPDDDEP